MYNTFFNAVLAEIFTKNILKLRAMSRWFIIDQVKKKKKKISVCFNKFVGNHNGR